MGNYQNTTDPRIGEPESPTIGISAHGLKGCLILLKNESCQNCVLTIPLCRGGRDEVTVENRVEIGRRKRPHAPSRSGRVAGHAHRRAPRVFFARMGWPDPNTRRPDWRAKPGWVWRHHDVIIASACHVSASQLTRQHGGTHLPRHQPRAELRRAELSRAKLSWAELHAEG
jgi:hypothetical protein